jgi:hypothetical protein
MYRTRRLVYFLSNTGKTNLRRNQYRIEFQRLEENRKKRKTKNDEVYIMCNAEYHPLFDSENENQIKNGNKEKFRACSN